MFSRTNIFGDSPDRQQCQQEAAISRQESLPEQPERYHQTEELLESQCENHPYVPMISTTENFNNSLDRQQHHREALLPWQEGLPELQEYFQHEDREYVPMVSRTEHKACQQGFEDSREFRCNFVAQGMPT